MQTKQNMTEVSTEVLTGESALLDALQEARNNSQVIADSTNLPSELVGKIAYSEVHCTEQGKAGFGVTHEGSLVALFNQTGIKGLGSELVNKAIAFRAYKLDCFDGPLVKFYKALGFVEYNRVPNCYPKGPDVVFMKLAAKTELDRILTETGVFLTYVRPDLSPEEEAKRFQEFLGSFGTDYLACLGVWEGQYERSFWVPLTAFNLGTIASLANAWEQDAILISSPENGRCTLLERDGSINLGCIQKVTEREAKRQQGYTVFFDQGEKHYLVTK